MILITGNRFDGELRKLLKKNPPFRSKINKCLNQLRKNPNYPSLKLHKLSGSENFSVSVDQSIRIVLHLEGDKVFLLRIGTHDEVY